MVWENYDEGLDKLTLLQTQKSVFSSEDPDDSAPKKSFLIEEQIGEDALATALEKQKLEFSFVKSKNQKSDTKSNFLQSYHLHWRIIRLLKIQNFFAGEKI